MLGKTRMKRMEWSERFMTRDVTKARRKVNRNNIVFLFLLDTKQKVVSKFSKLQFLNICLIYYSLFCIIF